MNCNPADPKGSGIVDVWQEPIPVRFGAVDKSDRLTLDAIFQFFQEAAISHAENLGVGREMMAKTGQLWIISRMSVLVKRRPKYCETITVRSWPCGWEKLFAIRDYEIKDKDDVSVVSARSAWLIVDMEKRRPLRPQSVMDDLPLNENLQALSPEDRGVTGLIVRNNLQLAAERKALYTDIDYNGHVNNVRYIQWIEDTLDPKLLEKAEKVRMDINYLNEILEGETIELLSAQLYEDDKNMGASHIYAFEGRKKETSQAAFRAELRLWNSDL
jgi:acyl-ACP thioesterase